jgi:hypothetical protein
VEIVEGDLLKFEEFMRRFLAPVRRNLVDRQCAGGQDLIPKVLRT